MRADAPDVPIVPRSLGVAPHKPTAADLHHMSALGLRYVRTDRSGGIDGDLFASPHHVGAVAVIWSGGFEGLILELLGATSIFTPTGWRASSIADKAGKAVAPAAPVTCSPLFAHLMPVASRNAVPSCAASR